MATTYRGLTIRIGGDVSSLQKSLRAANSSISQTGMELKKLGQALKLDPTSVKAYNLQLGHMSSQATNTAAKLATLKKTIDQVGKEKISIGGIDGTIKKLASGTVEFTDGIADASMMLGIVNDRFTRLDSTLTSMHREATALTKQASRLEKIKLEEALKLTFDTKGIDDVKAKITSVSAQFGLSDKMVDKVTKDVSNLSDRLRRAMTSGGGVNDFVRILRDALPEGVTITNKALTSVARKLANLNKSFQSASEGAERASSGASAEDTDANINRRRAAQAKNAGANKQAIEELKKELDELNAEEQRILREMASQEGAVIDAVSDKIEDAAAKRSKDNKASQKESKATGRVRVEAAEAATTAEKKFGSETTKAVGKASEAVDELREKAAKPIKVEVDTEDAAQQISDEKPKTVKLDSNAEAVAEDVREELSKPVEVEVETDEAKKKIVEELVEPVEVKAEVSETVDETRKKLEKPVKVKVEVEGSANKIAEETTAELADAVEAASESVEQSSKEIVESHQQSADRSVDIEAEAARRIESTYTELEENVKKSISEISGAYDSIKSTMDEVSYTRKSTDSLTEPIGNAREKLQELNNLAQGYVDILHQLGVDVTAVDFDQSSLTGIAAEIYDRFSNVKKAIESVGSNLDDVDGAVRAIEQRQIEYESTLLQKQSAIEASQRAHAEAVELTAEQQERLTRAVKEEESALGEVEAIRDSLYRANEPTEATVNYYNGSALLENLTGNNNDYTGGEVDLESALLILNDIVELRRREEESLARTNAQLSSATDNQEELNQKQNTSEETITGLIDETKVLLNLLQELSIGMDDMYRFSGTDVMKPITDLMESLGVDEFAKIAVEVDTENLGQVETAFRETFRLWQEFTYEYANSNLPEENKRLADSIISVANVQREANSTITDAGVKIGDVDTAISGLDNDLFNLRSAIETLDEQIGQLDGSGLADQQDEVARSTSVATVALEQQQQAVRDTYKTWEDSYKSISGGSYDKVNFNGPRTFDKDFDGGYAEYLKQELEAARTHRDELRSDYLKLQNDITEMAKHGTIDQVNELRKRSDAIRGQLEDTESNVSALMAKVRQTEKSRSIQALESLMQDAANYRHALEQAFFMGDSHGTQLDKSHILNLSDAIDIEIDQAKRTLTGYKTFYDRFIQDLDNEINLAKSNGDDALVGQLQQTLEQMQAERSKISSLVNSHIRRLNTEKGHINDLLEVSRSKDVSGERLSRDGNIAEVYVKAQAEVDRLTGLLAECRDIHASLNSEVERLESEGKESTEEYKQRKAELVAAKSLEKSITDELNRQHGIIKQINSKNKYGAEMHDAIERTIQIYEDLSESERENNRQRLDELTEQHDELVAQRDELEKTKGMLEGIKADVELRVKIDNGTLTDELEKAVSQASSKLNSARFAIGDEGQTYAAASAVQGELNEIAGASDKAAGLVHAAAEASIREIERVEEAHADAIESVEESETEASETAVAETKKASSAKSTEADKDIAMKKAAADAADERADVEVSAIDRIIAANERLMRAESTLANEFKEFQEQNRQKRDSRTSAINAFEGYVKAQQDKGRREIGPRGYAGDDEYKELKEARDTVKEEYTLFIRDWNKRREELKREAYHAKIELAEAIAGGVPEAVQSSRDELLAELERDSHSFDYVEPIKEARKKLATALQDDKRSFDITGTLRVFDSEALKEVIDSDRASAKTYEASVRRLRDNLKKFSFSNKELREIQQEGAKKGTYGYAPVEKYAMRLSEDSDLAGVYRQEIEDLEPIYARMQKAEEDFLNDVLGADYEAANIQELIDKNRANIAIRESKRAADAEITQIERVDEARSKAKASNDVQSQSPDEGKQADKHVASADRIIAANERLENSLRELAEFKQRMADSPESTEESLIEAGFVPNLEWHKEYLETNARRSYIALAEAMSGETPKAIQIVRDNLKDFLKQVDLEVDRTYDEASDSYSYPKNNPIHQMLDADSISSVIKLDESLLETWRERVVNIISQAKRIALSREELDKYVNTGIMKVGDTPVRKLSSQNREFAENAFSAYREAVSKIAQLENELSNLRPIYDKMSNAENEFISSLIDERTRAALVSRALSESTAQSEIGDAKRAADAEIAQIKRVEEAREDITTGTDMPSANKVDESIAIATSAQKELAAATDETTVAVNREERSLEDLEKEFEELDAAARQVKLPASDDEKELINKRNELYERISRMQTESSDEQVAAIGRTKLALKDLERHYYAYMDVLDKVNLSSKQAWSSAYGDALKLDGAEKVERLYELHHDLGDDGYLGKKNDELDNAFEAVNKLLAARVVLLQQVGDADEVDSQIRSYIELGRQLVNVNDELEDLYHMADVDGIGSAWFKNNARQFGKGKKNEDIVYYKTDDNGVKTVDEEFTKMLRLFNQLIEKKEELQGGMKSLFNTIGRAAKESDLSEQFRSLINTSGFLGEVEDMLGDLSSLESEIADSGSFKSSAFTMFFDMLETVLNGTSAASDDMASSVAENMSEAATSIQSSATKSAAAQEDVVEAIDETAVALKRAVDAQHEIAEAADDVVAANKREEKSLEELESELRELEPAYKEAKHKLRYDGDSYTDDDRDVIKRYEELNNRIADEQAKSTDNQIAEIGRTKVALREFFDWWCAADEAARKLHEIEEPSYKQMREQAQQAIKQSNSRLENMMALRAERDAAESIGGTLGNKDVGDKIFKIGNLLLKMLEVRIAILDKEGDTSGIDSQLERYVKLHNEVRGIDTDLDKLYRNAENDLASFDVDNSLTLFDDFLKTNPHFREDIDSNLKKINAEIASGLTPEKKSEAEYEKRLLEWISKIDVLLRKKDELESEMKAISHSWDEAESFNTDGIHNKDEGRYDALVASMVESGDIIKDVFGSAFEYLSQLMGGLQTATDSETESVRRLGSAVEDTVTSAQSVDMSEAVDESTESIKKNISEREELNDSIDETGQRLEELRKREAEESAEVERAREAWESYSKDVALAAVRNSNDVFEQIRAYVSGLSIPNQVIGLPDDDERKQQFIRDHADEEFVKEYLRLKQLEREADEEVIETAKEKTRLANECFAAIDRQEKTQREINELESQQVNVEEQAVELSEKESTAVADVANAYEQVAESASNAKQSIEVEAEAVKKLGDSVDEPVVITVEMSGIAGASEANEQVVESAIEAGHAIEIEVESIEALDDAVEASDIAEVSEANEQIVESAAEAKHVIKAEAEAIEELSDSIDESMDAVVDASGVEDNTEEIEKLTAALAVLKQEIDELNDERGEFAFAEENFENAQIEIEDIEEDIQSILDRIDNRLNKLDDETRAILELDDDDDIKKNFLEEHSEERDIEKYLELKEDLAAAESALNDQRLIAEDYENQAKNATQEIERIDNEINQRLSAQGLILQRIIDLAGAEADEVTAVADAEESVVEITTEAVESIEAEAEAMTELGEAADDAAKSVEEAVGSTMEEASRDATKQIEQETKSVSELEAELEGINKRIDTLTKQRSRLTELGNKSEEYHKILDTADPNSREYRKAKRNVGATDDDLERAQIESEGLEDRITAAKAKRDAIQARLTEATKAEANASGTVAANEEKTAESAVKSVASKKKAEQSTKATTTAVKEQVAAEESVANATSKTSTETKKQTASEKQAVESARERLDVEREISAEKGKSSEDRLAEIRNRKAEIAASLETASGDEGRAEEDSERELLELQNQRTEAAEEFNETTEEGIRVRTADLKLLREIISELKGSIGYEVFKKIGNNTDPKHIKEVLDGFVNEYGGFGRQQEDVNKFIGRLKVLADQYVTTQDELEKTKKLAEFNDLVAEAAATEAKIRQIAAAMSDMNLPSDLMRSLVEMTENSKVLETAYQSLTQSGNEFSEMFKADPSNLNAIVRSVELLSSAELAASERAALMRQTLDSFDVSKIESVTDSTKTADQQLFSAAKSAEQARVDLANIRGELAENQREIEAVIETQQYATLINPDNMFGSFTERQREFLEMSKQNGDELTDLTKKREELTEKEREATKVTDAAVRALDGAKMRKEYEDAANGAIRWGNEVTLAAKRAIDAMSQSAVTSTFGDTSRIGELSVELDAAVARANALNTAYEKNTLNLELRRQKTQALNDVQKISARQVEEIRKKLAMVDTAKVEELKEKFGTIPTAVNATKTALVAYRMQLKYAEQEMARLDKATNSEEERAQIKLLQFEIFKLQGAIAAANGQLRDASVADWAANATAQLHEAETAYSTIVSGGGSDAAFQQAAQRIEQYAERAASKIVESSNTIDAAYRDMRKTVEGTEEQFKHLYDAAINYSQVHAVSADTILEMESYGGQLGVAIENLEEFGAVASNLTIATDIGAEDVALQLGQMTNIMSDLDYTTFDNFADALVRLGNNIAAQESSIMNVAQRMAAVANATSMTTEELLGWSGAIASTGQRSESAATAIVNSIEGIGNAVAEGGAKLDGFAKIAGMSSEEFKKEWEQGSSKALEAFVKGLGKLTDDSTDAIAALDSVGISSVRQETALLALSQTIDNLDEAMRFAKEGFDGSGDAAREAEEKSKGFSGSLAKLQNNVTNLASTFGDGLIPYMDAASSVLGILYDILNSLSPAAKTTVVGITGITTALAVAIPAINEFKKGWKEIIATMNAGGVLSGSLDGFKAKVSGVKGSFSSLKEALTNLGTAQAAMVAQGAAGAATLKTAYAGVGAAVKATAMSIGSLVLPIVAIGALVAIIGEAVNMFAEWKAEQDLFAESTRSVESVLGSAKESVDAYAEGLRTATRDAKEIKEESDAFLQSQADFVKAVSNVATDIGTSSASVQYYGDTIKELAGNCGGSAGKLELLKSAVAEYNKLTGTSIQVTDEETGKLSILSSTIDEVTASYAKQAEMKAYSDLLTRAIEEQAEANIKAQIAEKERADNLKKLKELEKGGLAEHIKNGAEHSKLIKANLELAESIREYEDVEQQRGKDVEHIKELIKELGDETESTKIITDDYADTLSANGGAIDAFNELTDEQKRGINEIQAALNATGDSLTNYGELNKEQLVELIGAWDGSAEHIVAKLKEIQKASENAVTVKPSDQELEEFKRKNEAIYEQEKRTREDFYDSEKRLRDQYQTRRKNELDDEYDMFKAEKEKEYEWEKRLRDDAYDDRKAELDAEYEYEKRIRDDAYDDRKAQLDAEYEWEKRLREDAYDDYKKTLDDAYDEAKQVSDDWLDDYKDSLDAEVDAFEKATDERIKLMEEEYEAKKKLIDEQEESDTDAIDAQIQAIKDQTAAEEKAAEMAERQQKIAEATAKRDKYSQGSKAWEKYNLELENLQTEYANEDEKERREQIIEELEKEKDAVKEGADSRRDILKESLDQEKEAYKTHRDEQKEELKKFNEEQYEEQKRLAEAQLKLIKDENDAALLVKKRANEDELTEIKRKLDQEAEDYKRANDDELTEIKRRLDQEAEDYKRANDDELTQIKLDQDQELEEYKRGQDAHLELLKYYHDQELLEIKRRHDDELKKIKDHIDDENEAYKNGGQPAVDALNAVGDTAATTSTKVATAITDASSSLGELGNLSTDAKGKITDALGAIKEGLTSGDPEVVAATKGLVSNMSDELYGIVLAAQQNGIQVPAEISKAIMENANLSQESLNTLVNTITGSFGPISPAARTEMENAMLAMSTTLTSKTPETVAAANQFVMDNSAALSKLVEAAKGVGIEVPPALANAINSTPEVLTSSMNELANTITNGLGPLSPNAKTKIEEMFAAINSGLTSPDPNRVEAMKSLLEDLSEPLGSIVTTAEGYGVNVPPAIVKAMAENVEKEKSKLPPVFKSLFSEIDNKDTWDIIAHNDAVGYINKLIEKFRDDVVPKATELALNVAKAFAGAHQINSPSRLFGWYAEMDAEGFMRQWEKSTYEMMRMMFGTSDDIANAFDVDYSDTDAVDQMLDQMKMNHDRVVEQTKTMMDDMLMTMREREAELRNQAERMARIMEDGFDPTLTAAYEAIDTIDAGKLRRQQAVAAAQSVSNVTNAPVINISIPQVVMHEKADLTAFSEQIARKVRRELAASLG